LADIIGEHTHMGFQSVFRSGRLATPLALAGLIVAAPYASNALAAAAGVEEITVTAQRTEENIQDVPIAVSAYTGAMLADKQIINTSDLQLNTPNMSFTVDNFGGANVSIRGVGALVIAASGTAGVSFHINEIAMPTNLPAYEFYDMERVEVLRGPQGTLYGRNATGGVVDLVTAKPNVDAVSGNIDMEYGSYADERYKGAFNLPITDTFAVRAAGMQLKRDGYIENTANGQIGCQRGTGPNYGTPCAATTIQGIDNDIDGRDLYTYRVTGLWNATENATLWVLFSKFHENDDKVRITNQVCKQSADIGYGCDRNESGFEQPSQASGTAVVGALNGTNPLGEPNPPRGFPIEQTGFRKMHTDFEPVYKYDEDIYEANFSYDFDKFSLTLDGGYFTSDYVSQQDYNMDVGYDMAPLPASLYYGPISNFPTSMPVKQFVGEWTDSQCNYNNGTAGIYGGCVTPADQTRSFTYDQSDAEVSYWTGEVKFASHFDGKLNFLVGANYAEGSSDGDYYVLFNQGDLASIIGIPGLAGTPPLYPGFFDATGGSHGSTKTDSTAVFGEVYFQVTDSIKITGGLRWNDDNIETSDSSVLFNSLNLCSVGLGGLLGGACDDVSQYAPAGTAFMRTTLAPAAFDPAGMAGCVLGAPCSTGQTNALNLMNYYNITTTWLTDLSTGDLPGAYQSLLVVPPVQPFNEQRALTGSPDQADWQETTGRLGVDWQINDNTMVYAQYTKGYKPGGFNPPLNSDFITSGTAAYTFEPEKVKAWEIGTKNSLFDSSLVLNAAAFYYTYDQLQVSAIANNTALNSNIDATIWGAELETVYIPSFLPALTIDVAYSYLNTNIDNSSLVDPLDRGAGDPAWISLESVDPNSNTGTTFVAVASQITPAFVQQAFADPSCPALSANNPNNAAFGCPTPIAGTDKPGGIPAYWAQSYLINNGIDVSDGRYTDIDGNQLPQAPENKIHIGIAYTFTFSFGTVTPRFDYSWQDEMYAREFNTQGDAIDSWDQMNASILYTSTDGRWEGRAWIRNIEDEDNVTGKYLTSDTSGFYRNYFLTEPRIYGATVKYSFGAL
jgi:outer membrane receptor protein involved in Fe transport